MFKFLCGGVRSFQGIIDSIGWVCKFSVKSYNLHRCFFGWGRNKPTDRFGCRQQKAVNSAIQIDRIYFYFSRCSQPCGDFQKHRPLSAQLNWKYMEVHCSTFLQSKMYLFLSFLSNVKLLKTPPRILYNNIGEVFRQVLMSLFMHCCLSVLTE